MFLNLEVGKLLLSAYLCCRWDPLDFFAWGLFKPEGFGSSVFAFLKGSGYSLDLPFKINK